MDAFERGHPRALVLRGFSCFAFPTRIEIRPPHRAAVAGHLRLVAALSLLLTSRPFRPKTHRPEYLCKGQLRLANFGPKGAVRSIGETVPRQAQDGRNRSPGAVADFDSCREAKHENPPENKGTRVSTFKCVHSS